MIPEVREIYQRIQELHILLHAKGVELTAKVPQQNLVESTDIAYALRESVSLLEAVRKNLEKISKLTETQACIQWTQEANASGEVFRIQTSYCSAEPDIKQIPRFPQKRRYNPELYDKIMRAMGIPEELIESEVVRPHWPEFVQLHNKRLVDGKPVLDGLNPHEMFSEYGLKIRKIKDVNA